MNDQQKMTNTENEVKFFLSDLHKLEEKLLNKGAVLQQSRVQETNLRFDTPDGKLAESHQVLRLRKDQRVRLTFKGPANPAVNIAQRTELEVTVSDFAQTQKLLESLGYTLEIIYEKYRTTYEFLGGEVVLDELPFGEFCEIEGDSEDQINRIAGEMELDWDFRIIESYISIFNRISATYHLELNDLTFASFPVFAIAWEELDIHPAD